MNGKRCAALLVALGVIASQAGHLLVYQLRFGAAAQQVQSSGAHAYFPTLAKTGLGVFALALLGGLFMVGLARVASGRRLDSDSAPSYLRLLAALYTVQLVFFVGQETLEGVVSGGPSATAADLILWGTVGQLPVAALAATALHWLLARARPAVTAVRLLFAPISQPLELTLAVVSIPEVHRDTAFTARFAASPLSRRGPPSF